ncbi:MAG TPA: aminotransferase class I/II-fold pyridoxal phosphate-dependent enzyme, partial [Actinomycetota bacterium]|nr:aminotransferase class I/II-fold pyridoxal phosphate-dependent enzyme [Actinomycetota bacterium]
MSTFRAARRITGLPPYLFAELDKRVAAKRAEGADVISFGIGDPDFPTPPHIVQALKVAADDPTTHNYPSYSGLPALRDAIAAWMQRRFGVSLDPATEVLPIWGSKEGIVHLPWAMIDDGDVALCADPGYPPYDTSIRLAGGEPVSLLLSPDDGFLPRLSEVPDGVAQRTKLMFLDYPSNPTGATCDLSFFEEAVDFGRRHDVLIAHDAAYSEVTFDGYTAPSVLQVDGAKDVAVEIHSFSKTYNMTGWRIGWAAGNAAAIAALARVKAFVDTGQFLPVQAAAAAALASYDEWVPGNVAAFRQRRDVLVASLREAGLEATAPAATMYLWV